MTDLQTRRMTGIGELPTGGGMQRLLEAHRLITADLSLQGMLERIAAGATALTEGDYAGIAILGASGGVAQCAQHNVPDACGDVAAMFRAALDPRHGSTPAERARVAGRGRLVGSTVVVRGAPFAEIFAGTAGSFTDGAGQLLDALAELAGTALENALLNAEAERTKDWLQASDSIARALLSDAEGDMLMEVVERALHVAEADSAGLLLPDGDGRLRVAVASGRGAEEFRGTVIDGEESPLGRAILRGESVLVDSMAEIMREGYDNGAHLFGPVMATPLVDARGVRGSVVLCRSQGRVAFTLRDLDFVTTFADQLALALEMDDARLRGERMKVLEDRHRIGQDLHDNVMQRLFATGVGLQSLAASSLPTDVARRLGRYIAELDETIDEIRTRVFGLRNADGRPATPAGSRFPRVAPGDAPPPG